MINKSLEGKHARVITNDGQIYEGVIEDYIFPEDNEPEGIAAINMYKCLQKPDEWIGFNENEIKSIEIIS